MPIRILIVDDHSVVRQGLRMFLQIDQDLCIVGEASNGEEAVEEARKLNPDIVLMDLLMPGMDGIEATAIIRKELPDTEVIALTSVATDQMVIGAMRAGAIGYILKDTGGEDLRIAIKAAAAGQVLLSPQVAAHLISAFREQPVSPGTLTKRELEVLGCIANGESNKEIAARIFVSEETVKTHVSNILGKLGMTSRTQAALYAMRIGLVPRK
ncbi:MAG: DNA-binding response regulator [Treponema sp. GWB1_62_6]|nr:MAG: DNA-binding response regulator [Treponema sp. GWB1_62_6]OHE68914.1 MAG: DNA-binding response regulator [Treponema sp. RIFOXYC1_FULL_61_9]OHE69483.1 MAG: DNA-binding response regulator [Treponema sp. GWC1_61_84]HCM27405.1 DNA-binding response regulator [Treponema sp.]